MQELKVGPPSGQHGVHAPHGAAPRPRVGGVVRWRRPLYLHRD